MDVPDAERLDFKTSKKQQTMYALNQNCFNKIRLFERLEKNWLTCLINHWDDFYTFLLCICNNFFILLFNLAFFYVSQYLKCMDEIIFIINE